jgi:hypothetical protein
VAKNLESSEIWPTPRKSFPSCAVKPTIISDGDEGNVTQDTIVQAIFHFGIVHPANAPDLLSPLVHRVLSAACTRLRADLK